MAYGLFALIAWLQFAAKSSPSVFGQGSITMTVSHSTSLRRMRPVRSVIVLGAAAMVAAAASDAYAQTATRAQVFGSVFDSVGMKPLAGAVVRLVRTEDPSIGRTAISDVGGRFAYDSVASGVWLVSYFHPTLDSLRLEPALVRLEILDSTTVIMPLSTPSARSLATASCGARLPSDVGIVVGDVRRAGDNAPIAGATVEVEWPEWSIVKKRLVTIMMRRRARSDSSGRYALCGAPVGSTLRAVSWIGNDTTGAIEVDVPSDGYALKDFAVGALQYVDVGDDSVASTPAFARMRRGRATVHGVVTKPDGSPLANAVVRVIGTGSPTRTSSIGEFTITDAGAGTQSIEALAIGYQPTRRAVRLSESEALEVSFSQAARNVALDTVRVFAGRELPYEVRGIERRWRAGQGKFIDGKTVRDRASMFTTDALRGMSGVEIRPSRTGFGQDVMMHGSGGRLCRATLFMDGMQMDLVGDGGISIDDYARPEVVAVLEVYSRPGAVPAEYMNMLSGCGVIAVWTKFGTRNVPVFPPKSLRR